MRDEAAQALREFYEVVERLRAPGGCPWDREQTHKTLGPYLIEEAYELLDSINAGDASSLQEELGDVLLQVFMHSTIAAESSEENFDIGDVATQVKEKMIHRHPHVFGDESVSGAADVVVNWEKLKAAEKDDRESLLDGIPRSLPSLAYAQAVQKRPARLNLDQWHDLDEAVAQANAALHALSVAAKSLPPPTPGQDWVIREGEIAKAEDAGDSQVGEPSDEIAELAGKLLWAAAAVTRLTRVNAEDALRQAADQYAAAFKAREQRVKAAGGDMHNLTREQWDQTT